MSVRVAVPLALALSFSGIAAADWKETLKKQATKQADEQMETSLGLSQPASQGAAVYFIEPADGATVSSPVTVKFGLKVMGVAPAGINQEGTGHHHLLINDPTIDYTKPLPANDQVKHFGGGQTEATVELPAGTHTLQLLLGDWKHQPHQPPVLSNKITVTVK